MAATSFTQTDSLSQEFKNARSNYSFRAQYTVSKQLGHGVRRRESWPQEVDDENGQEESQAKEEIGLKMIRSPVVATLLIWTAICLHETVAAELPTVEPVSERLVVLTFDDSVKSHFSVVRPILLQHGFGATFFVTEGFDFRENKQDYMTWAEIAQLAQDGFEIGNHTRDHLPVTAETIVQLPEQLEAVRAQCQRHGIPPPVSFAYPGNSTHPEALPILREHGILFARRGGAPEHAYESGRGFAYEPGLDHPLLIPSAGDARPNWTLADFRRAADQARHGRISVIQFHGVPDRAHPWVHTEPELFRACMQYLADHEFTVISMRQLASFVDQTAIPRNTNEVVQDRRRMLAAGRSRDNFRTPKSEADLRFWLRNMFVEHAFSAEEIAAATGLSIGQIDEQLTRLKLRDEPAPEPSLEGVLRLLPYPGGRHPRISFMDGAIRPQRETKCSVFAPWAGGGYVVVDVPEAIWVDAEHSPELLYLAHTHVPTRWSRRNIDLDKLEWSRHPGGKLTHERQLPNRVRFGSIVEPVQRGVRMEMWITNGTDQKLTGLRVQNCVMLKPAPDFRQLTTENRYAWGSYAACGNPRGDRWVVTAWEPFHNAGGNGYCPCLHSDPVFPDCEPGQTQRIRGWLSFYEGTEIQQELERLDAVGWRME